MSLSSTLSPVQENGINLHQRIISVQNSVRKATEEALSSAKGEEVRKFPNNRENDDPNTSFALGMTLFGQETTVIEHEIRDRLNQIEKELKVIVRQQKSEQQFNPEQNVLDENEESAVDSSNSHILFKSPEDFEAEAERLSRQISFLREVSTARTYLDEATSNHNALESASLLKQARSSLDTAEGIVKDAQDAGANDMHLDHANRVLQSIRVPIRRKKVDLVSRAESQIRSCVDISSTTIKVRSPADAYNVLEILGSPLGTSLKHFAKSLNEEVFQPLLDSHRNNTFKGPWTFRENTITSETSTGRQSKKGPTHILEWNSSNLGEASNPDEETSTIKSSIVDEWGMTFVFIEKVMSFINNHALVSRESRCQIVGTYLLGNAITQSVSDASPESNSLFTLEAFGLESDLIGDENGKLIKPMIKLMWDTCIPSSRWNSNQITELLATETNLRAFADKFEKEMTKMHFYDASSENSSKLSDFCSNFERKYAETRRCEIIGNGRDMLLKNDYHNTTEVGIDIKPGSDDDVLGSNDGMDVFELHKSCVSLTASRLNDLCRQTMDEAVEASSSILAPMLYRTARELLDLFRAIIPAVHGSEVANIPRAAGVFHNDCVFLAHQCLTLGLEYKEKFPPIVPNNNDDNDDAAGEGRTQLRQPCIFVDMVPPFRELADRSLGDMIEKQKVQLYDLVGKRITLLGDALSSNESLMEWTDAENALSSGLNHLRHISQSWKPILSKDVYNTAVGHLVDTIFAMYIDRVLEAKGISVPASHFVSDLFRNATRSIKQLVDTSQLVDRFTTIGRFMDMSLNEIQISLSEGVFQSVTGPELSNLIVATFDDSDKRRYLLKALANASANNNNNNTAAKRTSDQQQQILNI